MHWDKKPDPDQHSYQGGSTILVCWRVREGGRLIFVVMEAAIDVPYCPASRGLLRRKLHTISDTGSGHICSTIRHHKKNHSRAGSFIYLTFAPIAIPPPPLSARTVIESILPVRGLRPQKIVNVHCFTSFWLHNRKKYGGFTRHLCICNYGETDRLRW